MSKPPWYLPPGRVTRTPVKVRFEGVPPGSAMAHRLGEMLGGQIKRFYLKAAQAHAAGVTDWTAQHLRTPEMAIRYVNNHGEETLSIQVAESTITEALKQEARPWDWALIEVHIPGMGVTVANYADVRAYRRTPAPTEHDQVAGGYVYDQGWDTGSGYTWADGLRQPVLEFAPYSGKPWLGTTAETPPVEQVSSLSVDLRPVRGGPTVIDLDGFIWGGVTDYTNTHVGNAYTPNVSGAFGSYATTGVGDPSDPISVTPRGYFGGPPFPEYTLVEHNYPFTGYSDTYRPYLTLGAPGTESRYFAADMPDLTAEAGLTPSAHAAMVSLTRDPFSGLVTSQTNRSITDDQIAVGDPGVQYTWTAYPLTPVYAFIPTSTTPAEAREATIYGGGGWGQPYDQVVSQHTSSLCNWQQWEDRQRYPVRPGMTRLGTTTVYPPDLAITDYLAKFRALGRVTIDPVRYSLSFKPA